MSAGFEIEAINHATGTFANGQPLSNALMRQGDCQSVAPFTDELAGAAHESRRPDRGFDNSRDHSLTMICRGGSNSRLGVYSVSKPHRCKNIDALDCSLAASIDEQRRDTCSVKTDGPRVPTKELVGFCVIGLLSELPLCGELSSGHSLKESAASATPLLGANGNYRVTTSAKSGFIDNAPGKMNANVRVSSTPRYFRAVVPGGLGEFN